MSETRIDNRFYKAEQVSENVWMISSCFVHMYLVVGKKRAAVVDTGYGFSSLYEFVRRITDKELFVILTHGHMDHIPGIRDFDCDIYMDHKDMETARRHTSREILERTFTAARYERLVHPFRRQFRDGFQKEKYLDFALPELLDIEDGQEFDLGGISLKIVELPGHTPGSIGVLIPERMILIEGDAVNEGIFLQLPESCRLDIYINTLYKAKALSFDTLLHGHTPPCGKERIEDYIHAAENLDFAKGKLIKPNNMFCQEEIRECRDRKHRAKVVIAKSKLS